MKCLPPEEIEAKYVNSVYDRIAEQFDHTRYKPWPGVRKFVESLKPNTTLLDVGCGNGRNLGISEAIFDMGTDFSMPLCKIAASKGRRVFCSSALSLPLRDESFDNVICVAVIHHFASHERRIQCLREIARVTKRGGRCFVTAWATEQKKKTIEEQDQMVSWQLKGNDTKVDRYYHFFNKTEFETLLQSVPELKFEKQEWESDNWNLTAVRV